MATIEARRQANGTTHFTAIVRTCRGGTILHRESRIFGYRSAALTWAKHQEGELGDAGALVREQQGAPTGQISRP